MNRRKLLQSILADLGAERSYFDFKQTLDIDGERGRGRLVQLIAALANTNRDCLSFIVVGIEDGTREPLGAQAIDDSRLQQLVRTYIQPPLNVLYEAVPLVHSGRTCALGLLTIQPPGRAVSIAQSIWKLRAGDSFARDGSQVRKLTAGEDVPPNPYAQECRELVARSSLGLQDMIDEVLKFYRSTGVRYSPTHVVINDRHVVCYSGWPDNRFGTRALSEVWVQLLTEGVTLFWSALEYVTISSSADQFSVREHALLFWKGQGRLYPFEETKVRFRHDGTYEIVKDFIFEVPAVSAADIDELLADYCGYCAWTAGDRSGKSYLPQCAETFASELAIAALNGSKQARVYLYDYLCGAADGAVAEARSDALRTLRRAEHAELRGQTPYMPSLSARS